jgi:hypothetical protein
MTCEDRLSANGLAVVGTGPAWPSRRVSTRCQPRAARHDGAKTVRRCNDARQAKSAGSRVLIAVPIWRPGDSKGVRLAGGVRGEAEMTALRLTFG